jgi:hypothetical protein
LFVVYLTSTNQKSDNPGPSSVRQIKKIIKNYEYSPAPPYR